MVSHSVADCPTTWKYCCAVFRCSFDCSKLPSSKWIIAFRIYSGGWLGSTVFIKFCASWISPFLREWIVKFSRASGRTPTRGGNTCRAPSPPLKYSSYNWSPIMRSHIMRSHIMRSPIMKTLIIKSPNDHKLWSMIIGNALYNYLGNTEIKRNYLKTTWLCLTNAPILPWGFFIFFISFSAPRPSYCRK